MKASSTILAGMAFLWAGALGCVSPPTAQEVLDTGFRTPEMTFHTLQVGVRGDLPSLEYSCLSGAFRARHQLSQIAYREFRERYLQDEIAFWLGLPDAVIVESRSLGEGRHLLKCESHGQSFQFELVREDFWQVWANGEFLFNEPIEDGAFPLWAQVYDENEHSFVFALAQLPESGHGMSTEELNRTLSEFRIGREWKIDDFRGLDSSP